MELIDALPARLKSVVLPWEPVSVMPLGDIQLGSPGCDLDRLKRHIDWGVRHNVLWLGTGDYTDFLSPSNRRYLKNAGLYDTATMLLEEWHEKHLETLKDILEPTKGMWLGLHEGHHYFEFGDGTTSDTRLAQYLEAPFLGTAAVNRLTFKDAAKHTAEILIWSHHGEGAGQDPVARLKKVAPGFPDVSVFIQGHNTKLGSERLDTIRFFGAPGSLRMRSQDQVFVAAGGFMRGYQAGSKVAGRAQGSYVEKAMMRPTAIGGALLTFTPRYREGYTDVDIFVSI